MIRLISMDDELRSYIGFSVFPGIGPVRFRLLVDYFGSAYNAWKASVSELKKIKLGETLSEEFDHFRKTNDLDSYIQTLYKLHVSVLPITNPKYPKLLKQISDAPFLLYVKGRSSGHPVDLTRTIAVVGTRQVTPYGRDITRRITEGLVSYGFTVISGLAYGVDAVAHRSAIDAGGATVAVLGSGIDVISPPSNENLYNDIVNGHGAVVSEMPLGLRPAKGLFPARNRIISGLSLGVVVTEGAEDSGALITARNAGEQGREVFAVPGPVTSPYSRGPSKLLKAGAILVESADDIIEELGVGRTKVSAGGITELINRLSTKEEKQVIQCMKEGHMHIDELVRASGLTAATVAATITVLEMNGVIKNTGQNTYAVMP